MKDENNLEEEFDKDDSGSEDADQTAEDVTEYFNNLNERKRSDEDLVSADNTLEQQLKETYSIAEKNMEGWQRAQAEFANYRKRIERDRIQQRQDQTAEILTRYIEVVDDLDLALKNRPVDNEGKDWADGIDLVYRKMMAILEQENVVPMNALGTTFDPNLHEAISQEESPEYESGQVIEVLKQGYLIGERVIRPSLVRIAS
ncbi:MAG: nucleotide exchange factor GrpE [Chloroflexota bacterium]